MKLILFISIAAVLLDAKSCDKKNGGGLPECIRQMIPSPENPPGKVPPEAIYQYDYHNQKVYYVVAPCCDQTNALYDTNCNLLCHPDGGFTGKDDGKCPDFNDEKSNEQLIWKSNGNTK